MLGTLTMVPSVAPNRICLICRRVATLSRLTVLEDSTRGWRLASYILYSRPVWLYLSILLLSPAPQPSSQSLLTVFTRCRQHYIIHRSHDNNNNNKWPQALFFKITSSLVKLANCSTHGGETWCTCVLHRFHDDHNSKKPQQILFIITSSLLKLTNGTTHGDETWYACV